ncbi:MAG: septation protein IspZ [Gammaproteobacteria bacterium]|nr:septation protein IspZ [Gammaproteobacteria bacterium]MDH3379134.1 septation protein IspZ [Gammaproteobacteria bacterium]
MQLFIDYLPILFFFGAYFYEDIYFATTVLMAVMPLVLLLQWFITRKLNKIYLASTVLILALGSATLYFRDPLFLYWKPTVLNWAIALAFLGSQFIGDKTFVQRMMQSAAQLTAVQWRRLNSIWVLFFVAVGCINLYVAFAFSEATWVKFKLFGMFGITIIFVIIQTVWLTMTIKENESADQNSES